MANAPATASYTNNPATVPIDAVRLLVGDTDCTEAYLTDNEIRHFLTQNGTELLAAADAAKAIAAKVAKRFDYKHGPVSKSVSQLFEHFNSLADDLERRALLDGTGAVPIGLADEVAEKETADADESRVQPDFKKGMQDNPRSGPVTLSEPPGSTQL